MTKSDGLSKNIYLSRDFLPFNEFRKSACVNVFLFSSDNQSIAKVDPDVYAIFWPPYWRRSSNMAAPYYM